LADNSTGLNSQYDAGSTPFNMSAGIGSTNAPGSTVQPEAAPDVVSGPAIAHPVISNPYGSSQVAVNRPTADVAVGDTNAMSSDDVVPGQDPLTGLSSAQLTQTGAGMGSDITEGHHPNSSARRPA